MVAKYASFSGLGGLSPIPGPDIGIDFLVMNKLLPAIERKFGLAPDQLDELDSELRGIALKAFADRGASLVGKALTDAIKKQLIARFGKKVMQRQAAKYIAPGVGFAVSYGISFAAMRAIGRSHVDACYEAVKATLPSET